MREFLELLFAHRLSHLPRSAFETRYRALAAFRGQGRTRGHLLLFRFCRHDVHSLLIEQGTRGCREAFRALA